MKTMPLSLSLCLGREVGRKGKQTIMRRKKKKSYTTRFERELKRLECSVSYGETSGIAKKSGHNSWDLVPVD